MKDEKYKGFGGNVSSASPHSSKMAVVTPNIMSLITRTKSKKKRDGKELFCVSISVKEENLSQKVPRIVPLIFVF